MRATGISAVAYTVVLTLASTGFAATNICGDLDGSGTVSAPDALRLLRFAVGQNVSIECPIAVASGLCWDTNTDSICDDDEDIDDDGECTVLDCRGPAGPTGPTGPMGSAGTQGPTGPQGEPGVAQVVYVEDMIQGVADCSNFETDPKRTLALTAPLELKEGQKVIINASLGMGSSADGVHLTLRLCTLDGDENLELTGNGITGLATIAERPTTYSMHGVIEVKSEKPLQYGVCGCAPDDTGEKWDLLDNFSLVATIVN